jgi:site-specific DNA-methyltransferase (adenine-specific)
MEYLIKLVSRENSTILDPFAGSGTTGLACINLNRNYILIEKEKDYFDICNVRINKALEIKKAI